MYCLLSVHGFSLLLFVGAAVCVLFAGLEFFMLLQIELCLIAKVHSSPELILHVHLYVPGAQLV